MKEVFAKTFQPLSDKEWALVEKMICDTVKSSFKSSTSNCGRRADYRMALQAILHSMTTGEWLERICSGSKGTQYPARATRNRYFKIFLESGVLAQVVEILSTDRVELPKQFKFYMQRRIESQRKFSHDPTQFKSVGVNWGVSELEKS
jgi:transposase